MRVAGLISGTSLDAIDVAIVDITRAADEPDALDLALVADGEVAWPESLRARLAAWAADPGAAIPVGELVEADMEAGAAFADALLEVATGSGHDPAAIELVASHGQTLHHRVGADGRAIGSLQIGHPAVIAERTGCRVVADFRPRDIAAGGQGAPLVARFDALVFGEAERDVAVLNIGGIANLTVIPAGAADDGRAWDTGPGNAVLDALARRDGLAYDADGRLAAAGTVDEPLLAELLGDPWFSTPPPKSTGRERFGDATASLLAERIGAREDRYATATAVTARSIAGALRDHAPAWPSLVWVSGGGTRNPTLMRALAAALRDAVPAGASAPEIRGVDDAGIPSRSKEAIAFAFLGHETLHGRPGSLVGATGARHSSVLGAVWPAGRGSRRGSGAGEPSGREPPVRRLRIRPAASRQHGVEES